jgi:hypothetical protein
VPGRTAPEDMAWTRTHSWAAGGGVDGGGVGGVGTGGVGGVDTGGVGVGVVSGVVEGVFEGLVVLLGLVATVRLILHGSTGGDAGLLTRNMPAMPDETSASPPKAPNA